MTNSSGIQMVMGKNSIDTFLSAAFNEKEKLKVFTDPIKMSCEDLDDFIEGYINVFEETAIIEITT